jgi:hypothetical protein
MFVVVDNVCHIAIWPAHQIIKLEQNVALLVVNQTNNAVEVLHTNARIALEVVQILPVVHCPHH